METENPSQCRKNCEKLVRGWLLSHPFIFFRRIEWKYGNIMFTVVVMMILVIIILIRHKKSKKLIAIVVIGTGLVFFGIFQMYLYNVDKIVSVIEEEEGNRIFIDKGYDHKQQMIVTFYEDNGLLELVDEVKEKQ